MAWFKPKRRDEPQPQAALPPASETPTDAVAIDVSFDSDDALARAVAHDQAALAEPAVPAGPSVRSSTPSGSAIRDDGTRLSEDTTIIGSIATASDLYIAGRIEGDVESGAAIHIGPEAAVVGDISALRVAVDEGGAIEGAVVATDAVIGGLVRGRVTTSGRLAIRSSGRVFGDVSAVAVQVDEGATLQGRCTMTRR
ncbi:MAG: polymer-forming cytoskeletal protein [Deltaproteobacteria bacterium]|nr:polymer-forming cytoskeletal protein [Deltaproteobacteria bacterium]MBK8239897.1 polymer-forming cytoskeletal protein [Deltaproteobacteria bacterium]MBK8716123.1 polymer-forming cytoskeletal protein [Deltaproteobacteria bacterium]MBP7286807.1 polymer-forming cytoskeletal protein [Nannocystaceae bacterium]